MRITALLLLSLQVFHSASAETLSIQQILQQVVDKYPSITAAALQVARAGEESTRVKDQLSWRLNSSVAYNRETSLFGTASDIYNLSANLNRNLKSGGELGINASVNRTDSADSFAPTIPNPSTKSRIDVNYLHHFAKGSENVSYAEGMEQAKVLELRTLAQQQLRYDQLASEIIELYLSIANTQVSIKGVEKTLERGLRLQAYIKDEFGLGLSEKKDLLQVEALILLSEADKKRYQLILRRQIIALNRLMGRDWRQYFSVNLDKDNPETNEFDVQLVLITDRNAALKVIDSQLLQAESVIRSRKDDKQDIVDLKLYLGNEVNQGDTQFSDVSESEMIGGVSLHYNRGLDKSGIDAALRQAHYDRYIALEDKKRVLTDLRYDLRSLLEEIKLSQQTLNAFKQSVDAEKKKLNEALQRHRDGRIETDRIIDYESQLANSELSYDLQYIELLRRILQLELLNGNLWKGVKLPEFKLENYLQQENNS